MRRVLVYVVPAVLLLVVLVVLLAVKGGGGSLADVPGYSIDFPLGTHIATTKITGIGVESQEDRVYGTAAPPEAIADHFARALGAAGYRQTSPVTPYRPGGQSLGIYEQDGVTWDVFLQDLPQRIDGRTYLKGEMGYDNALLVRIRG